MLNATSAIAQEATPAPEYTLKREDPSTGSRIRQDAVTGIRVPINKSYAELTSEQKTKVRSLYEHLDETDEPPYPLKGTKEILRAISNAQDVLHLQGDLSVFVEVNADGTPNAVGVIKSPDERMTNLVATALIHERYKPGLCKGTPCKMQFPLRIKLGVTQ
ncbi:hypothetical protein ACO0K9_14805 [Undibacterium sp. Ji50W]|uniref:hypothetical protein n=1 Tax=Undibacterium sp. Ji50W TaxID=3413041 RepID=UPI003BF1BCE7